jgi:hypothetical protein
MLRVVVAFACSAVLHGCAAYSTLGNTKPIGRSFAFFIMQPIWIVGQRALGVWLKKVGVRVERPGKYDCCVGMVHFDRTACRR